jgi:hypothetical protein
MAPHTPTKKKRARRTEGNDESTSPSTPKNITPVSDYLRMKFITNYLKSKTRTTRVKDAFGKLTSTSATFVVFYKVDTRTTAYLGYTDIAEYRKFRFSTPILQSYNLLVRYNVLGQHSRHVFSVLKDVVDPNEAFGTNIEELEAKYTSNHKMTPNDRDYFFAGVVFHLANELDAESVANPSHPLYQTDKDTQNQFEAVSGFSIPDFDPNTVIPPMIGPHEKWEESHLEKYSRVFAVIKNLQTLQSPSRRKSSFLDRDKPYESQVIDKTCVPIWMQDCQASAPITRPTITKPSIPHKLVLLQIDRTAKNKQEKELVTHIEEFIMMEGYEMPIGTITVEKDPRIYSHGTEWRDLLRRQLELPKLRLDFTYLAFPDTSTGGSMIVIYNRLNRKTEAAWSDVIRALKSDTLPVTVVCRFCVIDYDEDNYEFEYHGVPTSLEQDIVHAGDIIRLMQTIVQKESPDISSTSLSLAHTSTIGSKTADAEDRMAVVDRIFEHNMVTQKDRQITPKNLFSNVIEMKKYHSNYDVLTPTGMLEWQRYAIEKVNRNLLVSRTPGLKISKNIRKDLEEAEVYSNQVAQDADVRFIYTPNSFILV